MDKKNTKNNIEITSTNGASGFRTLGTFVRSLAFSKKSPTILGRRAGALVAVRETKFGLRDLIILVQLKGNCRDIIGVVYNLSMNFG